MNFGASSTITSTTDDSSWIKCQSKTRPGQFYMFNKTSGETKWCKSGNDDASSNVQQNLKNSMFNVSNKKLKTKTPAQDRLKRLQHSLRDTEVSDNNNKMKCAERNDNSTTKSLRRAKKPQKVLKSKNSINDVKNDGDDMQKQQQQSSPNSKCKSDSNKTAKNINLLNKNNNVYDNDVDMVNRHQSTSAQSVSTNAVLQKRKRNASIAFPSQASSAKLSRVSTEVPIANKVKNDITSRFSKESVEFEDFKFKYDYKYKDTTATTSKLNKSANARLEKFQKKLHSNDVAEENNMLNNVEEMDWQTIIESTATVMPSAKSCENISTTQCDRMGDYYDVVNANLLRLSANRQSVNNNKWQTNKFYVIIDTNVLLEHLVFIKELSDMKLCDTKGTIIYVPYCVLQELDKLKSRTLNEGTKTLAIRAIKFLNLNIEKNSSNIQAQSATEELEHIINITCADDSIINCCLQVKQHIEKSIFLSEDVNLRNKASSSNILVSTKSDLISRF